MQSSYNVMMAEERWVGSAALQNSAVGCCMLDGVVVVVAVEKRRWVLEQTRLEEEQQC